MMMHPVFDKDQKPQLDAQGAPMFYPQGIPLDRPDGTPFKNQQGQEVAMFPILDQYSRPTRNA